MRTRWRFRTIGLLVVILAVLSPGSALGAARPRGFIVESYRVEDGPIAPPWAQQSIESAIRRLTASYNQADLVVVGVDLDDLDMRHVRIDQYHQGLPVFGGQVIAHLNAAGQLLSQSGHWYDRVTTRAKPKIGPATAMLIARRALRDKVFAATGPIRSRDLSALRGGDLGSQGRFATPPSARLLILPLDTQNVLAYQVSLKIEDGTDATAHHEYFVNANDGSIAWYYDSLPHENYARPQLANATGSGASLYSGTVSMQTWRARNSTAYMIDTTRGGMTVSDVRNRTPTLGIGSIFADQDNNWGDGTTGNRQSAGVDAYFGAAQTWDYYLNIHGRRGIDGRGFRIISRVHYGRNYNNAFWNGLYMTYGDGDGVTFAPLVALDVAGHEITHGVTSKTANLTYAKESGAANESFSDIFGTAVEFYSGPHGTHQPDYFIGEDFDLEADAAPGFRNMQDPLEDNDPDNYAIRKFPDPCQPSPANDNCGVHTNSGIQNNAFYLLAEGGRNRTSGLSVTGIGRENAEKIFYRALVVYLTPSARFRDVRVACLRSAVDLFGANSAQVAATAAAWAAVGVN